MADSLCLDCSRACCGCSWSRFYKPVKGWTAEKTVLRVGRITYHSYLVSACPRYIADVRDTKEYDKLKFAEMRSIFGLSNHSDNYFSKLGVKFMYSYYFFMKLYLHNRYDLVVYFFNYRATFVKWHDELSAGCIEILNEYDNNALFRDVIDKSFDLYLRGFSPRL